ncbi:MAG TPA: hypothetical protein VF192_09210 [Longimicrobiales bacterium]
MDRPRRLTAQEVTELEERMRRALDALHDFFAAARDDPGLGDPLRARAAASSASLAEARRDWPRIAQDWRQLREQIGELRQELARIEHELGGLWRSIEEEEQWPTGA